MTGDEIIRMAMQVGCTANEARSWERTLTSFAALVEARAAAAEREACLQIADDCAEADMHASMAANAIRARGQQ